MKSIELTQSQIKALQSGATMFLFPIKLQGFTMLERNEFKEITCEHCGTIMYASYSYICPNCEGSMCYRNFPLHKGDKDIFVQEEFTTDSDEEYGINDELVYYSDTEDYWFGTHEDNPQKYRNQWQPASKMTKEQSRYSFNECIDAKAIRVQDWMKYLNTKNKKAIESFTFHVSNEPISQKRRRAFESFYNQQLKEQNINRTYEDNDYIFLVEFA